MRGRDVPSESFLSSAGGVTPLASTALQMSTEYFSCSGVMNVTHVPLLPARPVRPAR